MDVASLIYQWRMHFTCNLQARYNLAVGTDALGSKLDKEVHALTAA